MGSGPYMIQIRKMVATDRANVARGWSGRGATSRVGRVRPDGDVGDGEVALAGLDDRLERVGEAGDHVEPQRASRPYARKPRGHVRDVRPRCLPTTQDAPASGATFLTRENSSVALDVAVAHDDVGLESDRRHEPRDVVGAVLVVGVGVHDHVGAELEAASMPA